MVKRPKSPDIEDGGRLYVVYKPYPLGANFKESLEEDQKEFFHWLATVIGTRTMASWVMFWKPTSRSMILLEIGKEFGEDEHGRLLGEHRWFEALKDPKPKDKYSISQVFHAKYGKSREAQKDGWKELRIKTSWFRDFEAGQGAFKHPYPPTYWCDVPKEDKTNKPLCCNLPISIKPPPPRAPAPVVGSEQWWAKNKTETKPTPEPPAPTGAWSKKPPPSVNIASANANFPRVTPSTTPSAATPRTGPTTATSSVRTPSSAGPTPTTGRSAWGKPLTLSQFASGGTTPVNEKPPWAKTTKKSDSKDSSHLTNPKKVVNAWAAPPKIIPETTDTGKATLGSIEPVPDPNAWSAISISWDEQVEEEYGHQGYAPLSHKETSAARVASKAPATAANNVTVTSSALSRGKKRTKNPDPSAIIEHDRGLDIDGDDDGDDTMDDILGSLKSHLKVSGGIEQDYGDNPSSGSGTTPGSGAITPAELEFDWENAFNDEAQIAKDKLNEDPICPLHNDTCKKGICKVMDQLRKDMERKAKLEKEKAEGGSSRRGGRGKVWGGNRGGQQGKRVSSAESSGEGGWHPARHNVRRS